MISFMYYIVPRFPSSFPSKDERTWACGMYTLKAIIEWYNNSQINNYIYYANGRLGRMTWYMLPGWLLGTLRQSWLSARRISCRWMKKEKKIDRLKSMIHDWPVILLISHAYSRTRYFSFRRAFFLQHYISLWWYDDEKRIFYVYDSNTVKDHHRGITLPVGNIILSYDSLLLYRRLGGRGIYRNFGIAVQYTPA
jgi:hypothetical protein